MVPDLVVDLRFWQWSRRNEENKTLIVHVLASKKKVKCACCTVCMILCKLMISLPPSGHFILISVT